MVAQFVRFLATVPLSSARSSFDNLTVQAIDPTESPVSEWDFREAVFGAPEVAAIAAQNIHEDTAYIVDAKWDLWTFESETLKWKQGPQPLEIICRGQEYDGGAAASDGQFSVDWDSNISLRDTREFWRPVRRRIHLTVRITQLKKHFASGCQ